jgi:hypothetical protein
MNYERIEELAKQAGYMEDGFGIGHWDMRECKKFVKLIVKECALTAGLYEQTGRKNIGAAILDRFGIEVEK